MDAKDQVELGNAWFEMAENANPREKSEMLRRAYWWYRLGVEASSGLVKAKIEQRMKLAIESGSVPESERSIYRTKRIGSNGGGDFEDVPSPHAQVVGLVIHTLTVGKGKYIHIHAVQPIYQDSTGRRFRGEAHGTQKGTVDVLEARAGYVVSGLVLRGGQTLRGLQVKFEPIAASNINKAYMSGWAGGGSGTDESTLEKPGKRLIGIYGKKGSDVDSLGLVFSD